MFEIKWDDKKVAILRDNYAYADLEELAKKLQTTVKGVIRKAQKLQLYRAKNNQINNGYKFCSMCQTEHPLDAFYKNKAKFDGYEYYCKKYYLTKNITTSPSQSGASATESGASATDKGASTTEYVTNRPKNPTVFKNGIEGKICNWCKEWKPLDQYSKDKNGIAQKKATCKLCYKNRYSKSRA